MDGVVAALDRDDPVALDALLEIWRDGRSPQVADLIDALSTQLTRALPPIVAPTRKKFHEQWLDLANAQRAIDVGRLLAEWTKQPWSLLRERLERLALRPDDPRIALELARFVDAMPTSNSAGDAAWTLILKLIERLRDVRCRAPIANRLRVGGPGVFWQHLEPRLQKVQAGLMAVTPAEVDVSAVHAALARFGQRPAPTEAALLKAAAPKKVQGLNEEELLRQIYDQPADDAARLVYADFCSDRGDPRGELIALQFKPKQTQKEARRVRELLKTHGRAWLRDIEPAVEARSEEFARGFVSACRLAFRTQAQRDQLLLHPAWNTVTRLWTWEDRDAYFLLPHPLKGLEELEGVLWPSLALQMARRPKPYPRLRRITLGLADASVAQLQAVTQSAAFPALTSLGVHGTGERDQPMQAIESFGWLTDSPLFPKLQTLELSYLQVRLHDWLDALRSHPTLTKLGVGGWPPMTFTREGKGWRARIPPMFRADVEAGMVLEPLVGAGLVVAAELPKVARGDEAARARLVGSVLAGIPVTEATA